MTRLRRSWGRWRLAARLARREVRRHWARSALVVLIIALPVAATQAAAVAARATRWEHQLPTAAGPVRDQRLQPWGAGARLRLGFDPRLGRPASPLGTVRAEDGFLVRDWTQGTPEGGRGADDLVGLDVVGFVPRASRVPLAEGALPRDRHEVVLSAELAERTGLGVGDALEVIASGVELEVVGIAEPDVVHRRTAWAGPPADDEDDWVPEALAALRPAGSTLVTAEMFALYWFDDGPAGDLVMTHGPTLSRGPDGTHASAVVTGAAAVAIGVGFVATVCSAAFAIGARRQLRGLGTLAATGAAPSDLVRAVLLQGTTLGIVGAGVATALTLAGRVLVVPDLALRGWRVPWSLGLVLAVAALGVAAGTLAALVPALTASRIPPLSALAGRRPERRHRLRSPWVGLVLVGVGLALLSLASGSSTHSDASGAALAAVGVLLVMAGSVAISPGVVAGLAAVCARRGGTTRLAGRSLARGGARSAAVVASTAVAVAIPVVLLVFGARNDGLDEWGAARAPVAHERMAGAHASTGIAHVSAYGVAEAERRRTVDEVRELMGPDAVVGRTIVTSDEGRAARARAVDVDALRRATGSDPAVEALAAGAVVLVDGSPMSYPAGTVDPGEEGVLDISDRPVRWIDPDAVSDIVVVLLQWGDEPLVAEDAQTVDAPTDGATLVVRDRPLSTSEAREIDAVTPHPRPVPTRAALAALGEPRPDESWIEARASADPWPPDEPDPGAPIELYVVLGAIVLALAVIGTASALAAADGRGDERIIAAVGAPPVAVRRRRALEAVLTATGATVLGVGLGSIATLVVLHHPFVTEPGLQPGVRFPFLAVAGTAVGIVVAVGAVTWLVLALGGLRRRRDLVVLDV